MPKYSEDNLELKMNQVKMEDKGEYIMHAENSYGRSPFVKVGPITVVQCFYGINCFGHLSLKSHGSRKNMPHGIEISID